MYVLHVSTSGSGVYNNININNNFTVILIVTHFFLANLAAHQISTENLKLFLKWHFKSQSQF